MRVSQAKSIYPSYKPPIYLIVPLILLVVFIVLTVALNLLARQLPPPVSPFDSFSDLFPGQPETALEARGIANPMPLYNFSDQNHEKYYDLSPEDGIFSAIRVMTYSGRIRQIDFTLRDHSLRVGDLAEMLGVYDYRVMANMAFFLMPDRVVIAKTIAGDDPVSPFISVLSVTFADD